MFFWFLSWEGMDGILIFFRCHWNLENQVFQVFECLHMNLCMFYIQNLHSVWLIQFCLVFLPLLIQHKAVLLTFKNKGMFLDVDPQKFLLRGTCVLFFCWFGGTCSCNLWGLYFLFLWIGHCSLALPVIHVPTPHLHPLSTVALSRCVQTMHFIWEANLSLVHVGQDLTQNSCGDLNDKDTILSASVEYCMVYTGVSLGAYSLSNISRD